MQLKTKLKKTRKQLGLTQAQLARRLGVSPRTIWAWEAGTKIPRPVIREGVAARLDVLCNGR